MSGYDYILMKITLLSRLIGINKKVRPSVQAGHVLTISKL